MAPRIFICSDDVALRSGIAEKVVAERPSAKALLMRATEVGAIQLYTPSGAARIVAHPELNSLQRVGSLGIDVENIRYLVDTEILPSIDGRMLVVLDPVSTLTLSCAQFARAFKLLLKRPAPLLATIDSRDERLRARLAAVPDARFYDASQDAHVVAAEIEAALDRD